MLLRSQSRRPKPTEAMIDLGDGDTLNIVFDRNEITPAWVEHAQRKANEDADAYALAFALAEVVQSWDLFEDDGVTPVATTGDEIGQLSFPTLADLTAAIVRSGTPSRAEGNATSERSSTPPADYTPPPGTPQNGPATSPSPVPSASPSPT